jgi:Leucine-rich repeat (LRR) protein
MNVTQQIINDWITDNDINATLILRNLNLRVLPDLPPNLIKLDCSNNQITTLPDNLSNNLILLNCSRNYLSNLPELPHNLKTLKCGNNELTTLPTLPPNLVELNCNNNELTTLPTLPDSLQELYCNSNELTTLPPLPPNLIELNCNENLLTTLPTLPPNLVELNCNENELTNLPELPNTLIELSCYNNNLTTLPDLPNSLQELSIDNINLLNPIQIQFLNNNDVEVYIDNIRINLIPHLPELTQEELNNRRILGENIYNQVTNDQLLRNANIIDNLLQNVDDDIKTQKQYNFTNNELKCENDSNFSGDELNNIDKIFLFLNEDTGKYIIYCYTADELITSFLSNEKLYKWNKDFTKNWPGNPDLNKRILKEPYTNSYINFDNLNKIIIYNCFLLKPTKKYRLGTAEVNWESRMHGRDIDIAMVYDVYPINYELIKNKVKISKDDIINFVPKLQDIDNRYNTNLIITNLDEKTDNIITDINSLNKNMNYQISNNKIQIINTKFYRQDLISDTNQYPNIIKITQFYK